MKKIFFSFVFLQYLFFISCSGIVKKDTKNIKTVLYSDFEESSKFYLKKGGKGLIIYFPKGSLVPLEINSSIIFDIEPKNVSVRFKNDFYIFIKHGTIMLSFDKARWVHIHNFKGLKKLLGIKKAGIGFGISVTKKKGIKFNFKLSGN